MRQGRPVVTYTLIAMCLVSYVLQLTVGQDWTRALVFAPFLGEFEPWRFLTAAFLHSPSMILHIAFNMYALWILGQNLEPALGRWRFVSLYLLSALGGTVTVTLLATPSFTGAWVQGVVGASGAVFGLFGAIFVVLRRLGRSATPIVAILVINAVIGFLVPGISWESHLGGLVTGLLLGGAYAYAPRSRRVVVGVGATAGVALLLIALAAVRYATI